MARPLLGSLLCWEGMSVDVRGRLGFYSAPSQLSAVKEESTPHTGRTRRNDRREVFVSTDELVLSQA